MLNFVRAHARGVTTSDNSTHGGADDIIDGDVILFKGPQNSDMGQAFRPAPAEHKAHALRSSDCTIGNKYDEKEVPHAWQ